MPSPTLKDIRRSRQLYEEEHTLDEYNAIEFFDFCKFSFAQRQEADYQWRSVVLSSVLKRDSVQFDRLVASWKESLRQRREYWTRKEAREKMETQMDNHIDILRKDTLQQTQVISGSITHEVRKRFQQEFTAPTAYPTPAASFVSASFPPVNAASSSDPSASRQHPTAETARTADVFLSQALFGKNDNVDIYFFDNPVSAWADAPAFCSALLLRDFKTSSKTAFRLYTGSLSAIKRKTTVDDQVRAAAKAALGIRESCFRTYFFDKEAEIVRATHRSKCLSDSQAQNESEEHAGHWEKTRPSYFGLLDNDPIPSDPLDDDFLLAELSSQESEHTQQDLTGEIPEPVVMDRLVGPGTISSDLSDNPEGRLVIGDCDISETIMRHRRSGAIQGGCIESSDFLLANFVVTRTLLLTLIPADTVDAVFPLHVPVVLESAELSFVARLSAHATTASFEELLNWFEEQPSLGASVVHRSVAMFLSEAGLWADTNWYKKGSGDNEDSFTSNLLKPLLAAAFGNFAGCTFRWSRDPLCSGRATGLDARLVQPDYQVSFKSHAIVLGEFKTAVASRKDMEDDYVKLVIMGKRAVDGLFAHGFPSPVVLIHGRGMDVDVYRLSLRAEAIYYLQSLGTFRLVSGPYELPLLLGLGPLISAQVTARSTFELVRSRKKVTTDKDWTRGTFDCKGVIIPA